MSLKRKKDYGILGYDPTKKRPAVKQLQCPHCWFAHHAKNVLTKHINDQHWDQKEVK